MGSVDGVGPGIGTATSSPSSGAFSSFSTTAAGAAPGNVAANYTM